MCYELFSTHLVSLDFAYLAIIVLHGSVVEGFLKPAGKTIGHLRACKSVCLSACLYLVMNP